MSHFEGFIILALVGGWLWLLPSARPLLKLSPRCWRVITFWFLAALPFICLRLQIPSLNFESGWAGYAAHNPAITLSNWPAIFMILFARLFLNHNFADWTGVDGRFDWIGKWDGFSSLYNQSTLGLPWLCLLITITLWFAAPSRRLIVIWMLTMFVGTAVVLTVVFTSFITLEGLHGALVLTEGPTGGRYLLPILLAWFTTMLALFFADIPSSTSRLDAGAVITTPPVTANASGPNLPALNGKYWLVTGAILILSLGVFVLPNNETASADNTLPKEAATYPRDGYGPNPAENADLQTRIQLAIQMDKARKFAEALQAYHEAARLYPTNPFVLNKLAWSLAMNPAKELRNGQEAVKFASRAVELTGHQEPMLLETLAVAYAENGQPSKAFEIARKALALAVLKDRPKAGEEISHFLESFSAGENAGMTNSP
jgi:hypothetical protein